MKMQIASKALWLLAFTLGAGTAAHAASVVDAPGDLITSYAGAMAGDIYVLSAFVNYNPGTDT
ncbi:MAG: hypothetical protein JWP52_4506, partial [Rhizobacter sp.]|nr:hypothetical protein [Rhizobacter sp.]